MGTAIGYKSIMGVHGQADFQTERACTNLKPVDKVLLRSESLSHAFVDYLHDYLVGSAGYPARHRVFEPVAGAIEVDVPYTLKHTGNSFADFVSVDLLIAAAMGYVAWNAASGTNEITMKDDLDTFLTIAWNKSVDTDAWAVIGAMINSMTLSCNAGESLRASFDILAGDVLYPNAGATTEANLIALYSAVPSLVMFDDFIFRIDDHGGVLEAANQMQISNFSLTVNNNLSAAQQTLAASSGHIANMEPIQYRRNGFREVTFEFTLPRYDADTLMDFWAADTPLQADLLSVGPGSEEFDIRFPNLKIINISAPIAGPEIVEQTVTCQAMKWISTSDMTFEDADPVGSTDPEYNSEVWIELDNERTAIIDLDGA